MMIFGMIILVFFSIIGLCAFITAITDGFSQNEEAVILLEGLTCENAEARIRFAARICRQYKRLRLRCICDKSDPAYDICVLMQREYPMMEIKSRTG